MICVACQKYLPILPEHCPQCAQFLPSTFVMPVDWRCGSCLKNPPPFTAIYPLFPYEAPIIHLITQLKFQQQLQYARVFSELFLQQIREHWYQQQPLPDLIIPVPLHSKRLQERGFNQALEIAKPLAKALALPLDRDGLKRIKPTLAQSGLSALARKQNMQNAFIAERDYVGLRLALIDDVVTTGHTVTECAHLLKQLGAKSIDIWCCARRDIALIAKTR